jgi:hypothetical protein
MVTSQKAILRRRNIFSLFSVTFAAFFFTALSRLVSETDSANPFWPKVVFTQVSKQLILVAGDYNLRQTSLF